MRDYMPPETEIIRLEAEQFCARYAIPAYQHKYRLWESPELKALILEIDRTVWARNLPAKFATYPSTWWDAFKARWFPTWLLRKYPARTTTICVRAFDAYPSLTIQAQPGVRHINITQYKGTPICANYRAPQ